jgi:predicted site-specific integrase-resolvase
MNQVVTKDCLSDAEVDKLHETKTKLNISYVRVSSIGQKDDLERQEKMVKAKYPNNMIIKDIGSGINLNRRGLNKIIELAIEGKINSCGLLKKGFGYDLIEKIITKYSKGEIIVINKKDNMTPEEELTRDVLELMKYL